MKLDVIAPSKIGKALLPKKYRHKFKDHVEKAGFSKMPYHLFGVIFYFCIVLTLFIYSNPWMGVMRYMFQLPFTSLFILTFLMWTVCVPLFFYLFLIIFRFCLDLKIYQRRLGIEDVMPDFLQLTSANIRAGMSIDRALWYAVRPRFGVLAKEIETVAKQTLSGHDLNTSLLTFSKKYDSAMVQRSMSLLIKGVEAGGEIGDLLNKISLNIQETKTMKKEIAANIMTYAIFITAASIIMAPAMFGLSYQLLSVIQSIMSSINMGEMSSAGGFAALMNLSESSIKRKLPLKENKL